ENAEVTKLMRIKRGNSFDRMLTHPQDESLKPASIRVGRHGAPLRLVPCFGVDPETEVDLSTSKAVVNRLADSSEVIVIDVPPPSESSDIYAIAPLATSSLLMVSLHVTRASQLRAHVEACRQANIRIDGIVAVREDRRPTIYIRRRRFPIQLAAEAVQGA